MSRLDEAMRRAAQQATGVDTVDTDTRPSLDLGDVDALGREPFPLEMPAPESADIRAEAPFPLEMPAPEVAVVRTNARARASAGPRREPDDSPRISTEANGDRNPKRSPFEHIDARLGEKVVIDEHILPASREQYRRLAAILHDAQGTAGIKVIMVASALPSEGKTLTASNLALTFSESYRKRVLLIDADLRRPALHGVFKIDSATGLADNLANGAKFLVRQISPLLSVLPAGRPSQDPMAGLTSVRMQQLLDEAKDTFDWVILDTPPLALLPDAHLLSSMMDGVLIVVKAGSTPHDVIKRSVDAVGRTRVLGVVLNAAVEVRANAGYQYEYYGHRAEEVLPERS